MIAVNGWHLFAHPLFLGQFERLIAAIAAERAGKAADRKPSANAKLLAQLRTVIFERIPQDPTNPRYRQGGTLGNAHKHWFRDKFGGGRFRVFFRYDLRARIIIYAWVNDANSLRTYGAKTDAYAVFAAMLAGGNPPDDWKALLGAASDRQSIGRFSDADPENR